MIKRIYTQAENSIQWKGDKAGYHALHSWVRKKFGRPSKCAQCNLNGKEEGKKRPRWNIEYALKPGKRASREISDYLTLCKSCHRKMDMTPEICRNISMARKGIRLGVPALWKRKEFCVVGHKRQLNQPCKECNRKRAREFYRKNYAKFR